MNKKLLALAAIAAMSVSSISAAEVSLLGDDCVYVKENAGQPAVATPVDGVYTIALGDAPEQDWDAQFFVKANKDLAAGQKYVFSFEAKTTSPRKVDLQFHKGNPGDYLHYTIGATEGSSFDATAEWAKYTFNGTVPAEAADANIIAMNLSTIKEAGTISFKDIKWDLITEGGDTPDPKPEQPAGEVIASSDFTTMSAYNFWKADGVDAKIENGALVVTNPTAAANFWDIQYCVADGFNLVGGATYTITAKVKGFKGALHYNFGTWSDNVMGEITVEEAADWQTVSTDAVAKADATGDAHLLFQTGDFVGTFQIASVVITKKGAAGVDAVEVAPVVNHWTVYNLMGVKVLDTDNEAAVNELANGIYVINGKKVAIRH